MGEGDGDVGEDGAGVVKIAMMMMAPGGIPAPSEARGREPPFVFFFFLDLLPRWKKGFPSGPRFPWHGRGESPSEIGSLSLSLSVSAFQILPFHRFLYSQRSVTPIGLNFGHDFYPDISFLRRNKGTNRLTGGPREYRARPGGGRAAPLSRGYPEHCFALILLPKNHIYSKKSPSFLSHLDSI